MPKRLFSTKPVGELHEADIGNELQRTLDARALVLLGIGAIIGTGIFVLTGTAAANHAGPALVVSFLIAGLGCALAEEFSTTAAEEKFIGGTMFWTAVGPRVYVLYNNGTWQSFAVLAPTLAGACVRQSPWRCSGTAGKTWPA